MKVAVIQNPKGKIVKVSSDLEGAMYECQDNAEHALNEYVKALKTMKDRKEIIIPHVDKLIIHKCVTYVDGYHYDNATLSVEDYKACYFPEIVEGTENDYKISDCWSVHFIEVEK